MDWIDDLKTKFSHVEFLNHLKKDEFVGTIEINFFKGVPNNLNLKQHIVKLEKETTKKV